MEEGVDDKAVMEEGVDDKAVMEEGVCIHRGDLLLGDKAMILVPFLLLYTLHHCLIDLNHSSCKQIILRADTCVEAKRQGTGSSRGCRQVSAIQH